MATVDSEEFLTQLKSLHDKSVDGTGIMFPFKEATAYRCLHLLLSIEYVVLFACYLIMTWSWYLVKEMMCVRLEF